MRSQLGVLVLMVLLAIPCPYLLYAKTVKGLRSESRDLVRYVNTLIGTDDGAPDYGLGNAAGDTPPGAAYPFGMVLWSPDTTNRAGGYRYYQDVIKGFSVTHFSGRGVSCYQDAPFMPIVGPVTDSPGTHWSEYSSHYQHINETAEPGYYDVLLDDSQIQVELTVTARTGFGRFTFPPSPDSTILINSGGSAQPNRDSGTGVTVIAPDMVTGSVSSGNCGGSFTYKLYFAVQFDHAFSASSGTWNGDLVTSNLSSEGKTSGAYLSFDTTGQNVVQAKIGLSFVSVENALLNLEIENPTWDFDFVRSQARAAWNHRLNSIQVQGGTHDEKTVFYTALYHALIHPSVFSDVNAEYIGFDNQVHRTDGFAQYHNFAGWDNYRSEMPLLALIAPEASDMMQSLVNDAEQDAVRDPANGGGLPRWQHTNSNSGGMIGDSQDVVIATVYAFGATNFDTARALAAMDRGASVVGIKSGGHTVREGLQDYLDLGYVSTSNSQSASRTLEYANDDFAISQFAESLGRADLHDYYLARAQNWQNLFHEGHIVPRELDGNFIFFDPASGNGFTESSGAQYVWMVPFNMRALFDAMGGNQEAVARLDDHFIQLNAGPHSIYAFLGNEPELKAPWSYDFAGAPWRTQDVVRRSILELYHNSPGGMPGNDDGGAMGSYVVFSCLGLFPDIPGVAGFVVGSPLFSSATIHMANGNVLHLEAPAASDENRYVQSLTLNGEDYNDSPWIPFGALSGGAKLRFSLANSPNTAWGTLVPPPSFDVPGPTNLQFSYQK